MRAFVGPDGCGKTHAIKHMKKKGEVVASRHAMPLTRWMRVDSKHPVYYVVKELIHAIERNAVYVIVRLEKPDILDRCFIDACAYSEFYSSKYKIPLIRYIAEWTIFLAPRPEEVIQLRVKNWDKWKPKREGVYTIGDVATFNNIYHNMLYEKGYVLDEKKSYYLGEMWIWRKHHAEKRIRVFSRLARRLKNFLSNKIIRNRAYKICSKFWRLRIKGQKY